MGAPHRLALLMVLVGAGGCGRHEAPAADGPDAPRAGSDDVVGAYVWHRLDAPPDVPAGVEEVFLLAGEIGAVPGVGIDRVRGAAWTGGPSDLDCTFVYRIRQTLLSTFETEPARIRAVLAAVIETDRDRRRAAGGPWAGFQIDFDCPTRLLDRYAAFLAAVRADVTGGAMSITTLPAWLGADGLEDVAGACDWLVAQMYAGDLPDAASATPRVTEAARLRRWMRGYEDLAARTGVPYVVALPTYGHVLVFDASGRRRAIAADLAPTDAWAASDLRALDPPIRETLHLQHRFAGPDGGTVRVTEISARGLAAMWEMVRATPAAGRRGVAFFRLPDGPADLALPGSTLAAVVRGERPAARLEADLGRRDDGARTLTIRNAGTAAHLDGEGAAVTLSVHPPAPVVVHVPLGSPYAAERWRDGKKVGPADVCGRLVLRVPYLGPGRTVTVPVIDAFGAEMELDPAPERLAHPTIETTEDPS